MEQFIVLQLTILLHSFFYFNSYYSRKHYKLKMIDPSVYLALGKAMLTNCEFGVTNNLVKTKTIEEYKNNYILKLNNQLIDLEKEIEINDLNIKEIKEKNKELDYFFNQVTNQITNQNIRLQLLQKQKSPNNYFITKISPNILSIWNNSNSSYFRSIKTNTLNYDKYKLNITTLNYLISQQKILFEIKNKVIKLINDNTISKFY